MDVRGTAEVVTVDDLESGLPTDEPRFYLFRLDGATERSACLLQQ
jgi:hypothetical protein